MADPRNINIPFVLTLVDITSAPAAAKTFPFPVSIQREVFIGAVDMAAQNGHKSSMEILLKNKSKNENLAHVVGSTTLRDEAVKKATNNILVGETDTGVCPTCESQVIPRADKFKILTGKAIHQVKNFKNRMTGRAIVLAENFKMMREKGGSRKEQAKIHDTILEKGKTDNPNIVVACEGQSKIIRLISRKNGFGKSAQEIEVNHDEPGKAYTLQTRKAIGWRLFGKGTKMPLAVVWKEQMDRNGFKLYAATEFYIDSQNQQGYQLREVIIKDGPVDNTFR